MTNIPASATAPSNDSTNTITLSDISGVWDMSQHDISNGTLDTLYIVINENGTFVTYDFADDNYDQGEECYSNTSAEIIDIGNGNFKIGEETVTIKIVEGDMIAEFKSQSHTATSKRSDKKESDFTPLCNEKIGNFK